MTQQHRWSSEAVWLFHQSDLHLFGSELADFQDAVLRGMLIRFIWDMNITGLEWLAGKLHTPAGARLLGDLGNGNFELLRTFFADARLVQPQDIGRAIILALSMFGVDVEACMARECLRFPQGRKSARRSPIRAPAGDATSLPLLYNAVGSTPRT